MKAFSQIRTHSACALSKKTKVLKKLVAERKKLSKKVKVTPQISKIIQNELKKEFLGTLPSEVVESISKICVETNIETLILLGLFKSYQENKRS